MKKLRHIFAIVFILFTLCISPSFNGAVGKAKNHYSQVVDNERLQFNVVNQHYKLCGDRWYKPEQSTSKGFKALTLIKIDNGCRAEITTPGIRS